MLWCKIWLSMSDKKLMNCNKAFLLYMNLLILKEITFPLIFSFSLNFVILLNFINWFTSIMIQCCILLLNLWCSDLWCCLVNTRLGRFLTEMSFTWLLLLWWNLSITKAKIKIYVHKKIIWIYEYNSYKKYAFDFVARENIVFLNLASYLKKKTEYKYL